MKKYKAYIVAFSILITIFGFETFAQLPDTWTRKADVGSIPRYGSFSFSVGAKGYLGTGFANAWLKDCWEYDPATDTWSQKADFGGSARVFASGFSIGSKGYVGCGFDGIARRDFWEYDPALNAWTQKSDFGGLPRDGAVSFSIGAKGYLGTGLTAVTTRLNDFWEYDPLSDAWSRKTNFMGAARAYAAGFALGSKGYIGTGNSGALEKDLWEYNPGTNTWIRKADFGGISRFGAVGFNIGGYGYLGLGDKGGSVSGDFWEYRPASDSWAPIAGFGGVTRTSAAGFSIANKGYVGTGVNISNTNYTDFWVYSSDCISPSITSEPLNNTLVYGASAVFTVAAADALAYQWQEDSGSGFVDIADGVLYSNTNTPSLTISLPAVSMSGYKYRCSIAGACPENMYTDGYATLTVAAMPIVLIPALGQAKVYGSADPLSFAFTFSPALVGTDVLTGQLGRAAGEDAGVYPYTVGTLNAGSNYVITLANTPGFAISPFAVVVTPVAGQSKMYGEVDPLPFAYTFSPALPGTDMLSGQLGRATGEDTGIYPFSIGTLNAGNNYVLTLDNTPGFVISPLAIVVTPDFGQSKMYGEADPLPFTFTASPALIGLDGFLGQIGRTAGENVGVYLFSIGTLNAGSNYVVTLASTPGFIISPLAIVVTPVPGQAKVYGETDPLPFIYTFLPPLYGTDEFSGQLGRAAGEDVGNYPFSFGTLNAGSNYILTLANTPGFAISPLAIVVTPNAGQSKMYGEADPLPFTYTYLPALIGSDVFIGQIGRTAGENVGIYPFSIGTLIAGSNYVVTLASTTGFALSPLAVIVTATAGQGKIYGSADPVLSYASVPSLVGGDSFTGYLIRESGENVGVYSILQGMLSAGTNYALTFIAGNFTITPKPILITADPGQSKIYGSDDPAVFTYGYTPALVGSDLITGLLSRVAGENAGSHPYTQGTLTAGSNYSLSVAVAPSFSILAKGLTVVADDKSKCFDGLPYGQGYTASFIGFVNGETLSMLGGTLVFGGTALAATVPGSYSIIPSGLVASNYALTYVIGTLVINPAPVPTIAGSNSLCAGSDSVLYTTEPGFNNYVWTISYGGFITSGLNSNEVTVNWATAGLRTISVNYQITGGCLSSATATLNLTVHPVPVPAVYGQDSICSGSTAVVYTTETNKADYIWEVSPGGMITSGGGTYEIAVNWTGSGNQTIRIDYANGFGCRALSPTINNVELAPLPETPGPVAGPMAVCAGTSTVGYVVSPVANASTYEWNVPVGATIVSGAGTNAVTVAFATYINSGTIKVTGVNTCGSGISSPGLNVQVNPVPEIPVITRHGDTLISSSDAGNQWYLDGLEIPGATGKEHRAVYLGAYTVVVTQNGCSSVPSNPLLVQPVSINDLKMETLFALYPNPSHGKFDVEIETSGNERYTIEIYNKLGVLIWRKDDLSTKGKDAISVDLQGSPAGMYTVALKNKANSFVRKIVILK